jgi:TPP-dependent pyruvate/acetoin dehydrogenase alpha subunit
MVPLAVGVGYGIRYRGTDQVCLCFLGDGAMNIGPVHEALNMAAIYKVPVVFICENNRYAMATPIEFASAVPNLAERARQYGMPTKQIGGMDLLEVYQEAEEIVHHVRHTPEPFFVEVLTYRFEGHGIADNPTNQALYRTKEEVEYWRQRDPIVSMARFLIENGIASESELLEWDSIAKQQALEAVAFADASPEPPLEELYRDVYTDMEVQEWR